MDICGLHEPWSNGKDCARKGADRHAMQFVSAVYPWLAAGQWPAGSVWSTENRIVQQFYAISNVFAELDKTKDG